MKKGLLGTAVARARKLREGYHQLERKHHGTVWTVEEDALAFLTDAGLVGRLVMAHEGRWPQAGGAPHDLEHKIGECLWWLLVLAHRTGLDAEGALATFLSATEQQMKGSLPKAPSRSGSRRRRV